MTQDAGNMLRDLDDEPVKPTQFLRLHLFLLSPKAWSSSERLLPLESLI
jgi:hypothetical protein